MANDKLLSNISQLKVGFGKMICSRIDLCGK